LGRFFGNFLGNARKRSRWSAAVAGAAVSLTMVVPGGGSAWAATPRIVPAATPRIARASAPGIVPASAPVSITPGQAPVTVTPSAPGQAAAVTMSGTAGEQVVFQLTQNTLGSVDKSVQNPDGSTLVDWWGWTAGGSGWISKAVVLPATGTYTIEADPTTSQSGSIAIQAYDVPSASAPGVSVGGAAVTLTATGPEQLLQTTFTGHSGERVMVQLSGDTLGTTSQLVVAPGAAELPSPWEWSPAGSGMISGAISLPADGTYAVGVLTTGSQTGSVAVRVYDVPPASAPAVTIGGAGATLTATSGEQLVQATFSGTAGQQVQFQLSGNTLGSSDHWVLGPDGSTVVDWYDWSSNSSGWISRSVTLPATGVYAIGVLPTTSQTGSITAGVYSTTTAPSVTVGGSPVTLNETVAERLLQATFTGHSGERVMVQLTGDALEPTSDSVLAPDGSQVSSQWGWSAAGSGLVTGPMTLPADGTYTIDIQPTTTQTGSVSVAVYDIPAAGAPALTLDAAPTTLTVGSPERIVQATFAGTAGQKVQFQLSGNTLGAAIKWVIGPDGSTTAGWYDWSSVVEGWVTGTITLPATGVYTVGFQPTTSGATGTIGVAVVSGTAPQAVKAPAVKTTKRERRPQDR
jgi:hypothetical protein